MRALEASGVTVALASRTVLDGVGIGVSKGEVVGLIGPNGAGKTTLLRALAALQPVVRGRVLLGGRPLAGLDRREIARRLAYLPEGAVSHWPLTVERLVALGRLPHRAPWQRLGGGDARAIGRAMQATGIAAFAGRTVATLSGGERTRVMLARALATEPEILLADEPVAALDPFHQLHVMGLLRAMAAGGAAVIVVLHDLSLAARFCDRLVLLAAGRVLGDGAPGDVLSPANLAAAYGIEALLGESGGEAFVLPWRTLPADGEAPPGGA